MKKFFKTLSIVLCLMMVTPSIIPNFRVETVQAATTQKELEKKVSKCLDAANKDCKKIMDSIYGSWYFQVYESDDYYDSTVLAPYCAATGIAPAKVKKIIKMVQG